MRAARAIEHCLLLFALLAAADARAQIYVQYDADGVPCFSDVRESAAQRIYLDDRTPGPASGRSTPAVALRGPSDSVAQHLHAAARRHGLDAGLLQAIARAESGFRDDARSPRGAMGLMQLMPATARAFGVADAYDARANIDAGASYFRSLLDRFGDPQLALAAYNAGPGAVERYGNAVPPFPETVEFVRRVQAYWRAAPDAAQARQPR